MPVPGSLWKAFVGRASQAAEGFAEGSASVIGTVVRKGVGGTLGATAKSLWSSSRYALRGAYQGAPWEIRKEVIPGIVRELFPSVKRGTLGALPKFGAAAFIDRYLETPDAQDMSGAGQFGLRAVSFGLKFGAYRSMARGAVGSALGLGGRAVGDPGQFYGAYQTAAKALGPFWKGGSLTNMAFKGVGAGLRELAYTPLRAFMGIPMTAKAVSGVAARAISDVSWPWISAVGKPFRSISEAFGATSYSAALNPRAGAASRALNKVLPGFLNKELDAPIMSTTLVAGGAIGYFMARNDHRKNNRNWLVGPKYNPANYGGGIAAMRRGAAQNYGPSLTLMLHSNHRRVMP